MLCCVMAYTEAAIAPFQYTYLPPKITTSTTERYKVPDVDYNVPTNPPVIPITAQHPNYDGCNNCNMMPIKFKYINKTWQQCDNNQMSQKLSKHTNFSIYINKDF